MIVERFTTRSGPRIRYLDNSAGGAGGHTGDPLPILFSPGLTDFADEYVEVLEFLAPRRMLVVEVRGRGGSESPTAGYAAADHARDLCAVLDEECIDRFHLMTFSRGTTWGLDLALADPRRVATVSIGDYWAAEKAMPLDAAARLMATRFRGKTMSDRIAAEVPREVFRGSRQRDLSDPLAAAHLPVLVATGDKPGCFLDPASIAEWRARVPGVHVVSIMGASHDLFRPDRLAYPRAVRQFVVSRGAGSGAVGGQGVR